MQLESIKLDSETKGINSHTNNNDYIPGNCNLGTKEIESRKKKALIGLLITIISIVYIQLNQISPEWRIIVFIPLFYSVICYYQAKQKFCVVFGIRGIFNFDRLGKSTSIADEEFKKLDRIKALKVILISFLLTSIIVSIYFFLPL